MVNIRKFNSVVAILLRLEKTTLANVDKEASKQKISRNDFLKNLISNTVDE